VVRRAWRSALRRAYWRYAPGRDETASLFPTVPATTRSTTTRTLVPDPIAGWRGRLSADAARGIDEQNALTESGFLTDGPAARGDSRSLTRSELRAARRTGTGRAICYAYFETPVCRQAVCTFRRDLAEPVACCSIRTRSRRTVPWRSRIRLQRGGRACL